MDEIDFRIVQQLQENGRKAYSEIAKRLNVSDGTVRIRTEKMIEKGLIRIRALVNPFQFEHHVCALVGVNLERREHKKKMEQISKLKGVVSVMNTTGRYDLFVELFVRSQKELMEFLVNEISKVDGIQATETFVYLDGTNKWMVLSQAGKD